MTSAFPNPINLARQVMLGPCQNWHVHFCRLLLFLAAMPMFGMFGSPVAAQAIWNNTTGTPDPWYYAGGNWSTGNRPTSTQTALFDAAGTYDVWWNGLTQGLSPEVGRVEVNGAHVTFLNQDSSTQYQYQINGGGSTDPDALKISGSNSSLTISGIHVLNLSGTQIANGGTLTVDGSHAAGSSLSIDGFFFDIDGNLDIKSGGVVGACLKFRFTCVRN